VEVWKAEECCNLEDGAHLHLLVCLKAKTLLRGKQPVLQLFPQPLVLKKLVDYVALCNMFFGHNLDHDG
jgi:hypothetical protein